MTAEIFLNNLQCNYMNIKDANLIIFDECHLAVLNHPFSKVSRFYNYLIQYNTIHML